MLFLKGTLKFGIQRMILFRNFEMYTEVNLPKEDLFKETSNFLRNLPNLEEIPGERFWILKIKGSLIIPEQGDLLTSWPYDKERTQLIEKYCSYLENKNTIFQNPTILVKAGYLTDTKVLNPVKYIKLIHLINEFKKKNNTLIKNS